jgi:dipeptidyl aminopeptidase/acylaminoacyl peptidase
LDEARQRYATRLVQRVKAPQPFEAHAVPAGVREVTYESGGLQLKGWLSAPPSSGLAPAVVFLHGGFAFDRDDWNSAQRFVRAGFVLFMPRLRAENGNPGAFEMFGGEVDDALAAGHFLASVPRVDPARVFVAGHSVGGSLAMLTAQRASPFRAGASLSAHARLLDWIDHFSHLAPFDRNNPQERSIRDPYRYVASVRIPLYMFTEDANPRLAGINSHFCALVAKTSVCRHWVVKGDHGSMVAPAIDRAIGLFRQVGN